MKNKIILGGVALILTITTLAGCGNTSEASALTKLSNELDKTSNSVTSVKSMTETDLEVTEDILNKLATQNKSEDVQKNINITQTAIENEQKCKDEIIEKTAVIKKYLSKNDLKLAKTQISALRDLSKNLSTYNNSISNSEKEFNSAVKSYNNIKRAANKNPEKVNAKLNQIACNSNARSAYYENLLNTLNQVESVLGIEENNIYANPNFEQRPRNFEYVEELTSDENEENEENDRPRRFKKNIDTYIDRNKEEENISEQTNYLGRRNTDSYAPYQRNIDTYRPYYNNGTMYNGTPYNNGAMPYNNGIYGGINNPYGYNSNNLNRFATPYASTENTENNTSDEKDVVDNKIDENLDEKDNKMEKRLTERVKQNSNRKIRVDENKTIGENNKEIKTFKNNLENKAIKSNSDKIESAVEKNKNAAMNIDNGTIDKTINQNESRKLPNEKMKIEKDNVKITANEKVEDEKDNVKTTANEEKVEKDFGEPRLEEQTDESLKIKEITTTLDVKYLNEKDKVVAYNK